MATEVRELRRQTINSDDAPARARRQAVLMEGHRPRVALDISTRLFRDALMRALAPYVDVIVAPDSDTELAAWVGDQQHVDALIVCGGRHIVDLDADLVVQLSPASGVASPGYVCDDGRTVQTLADLLHVLNVV